MDAAKNGRLLALARWAITCWVSGEPWEAGGPGLPPGEDRAIDGLFVTLHRGKELRGCLGTLAPQPSLDAALRQVAVHSASEDPRFPPVSAAELPDIRLSISVLSPFEPVSDVAEIEIGRHGLMIEKGRQRGLLLPEVPTEHGWDRPRFLEELCRKAFLPPGSWRDPSARLLRFETESISEAED